MVTILFIFIMKLNENLGAHLAVAFCTVFVSFSTETYPSDRTYLIGIYFGEVFFRETACYNSLLDGWAREY
jgi:hypothetical protein